MPCALGRRSDEHFRTSDQLAACRVVLADPGLCVSETVEVGDQLQVAMQRERRVDTGFVHRWQEDPELERRVVRAKVRHARMLP